MPKQQRTNGMVEIKLNIKPLAVSHCWQGRRYKTSAYHKFCKDISYLMPKIETINGKVEVDIEYGLKYDKTTDLDNLNKSTLDQLVQNGIIDDDRFIYRLINTKVKSENDYIKIKIKKI